MEGERVTYSKRYTDGLEHFRYVCTPKPLEPEVLEALKRSTESAFKEPLNLRMTRGWVFHAAFNSSTLVFRRPLGSLSPVEEAEGDKALAALGKGDMTGLFPVIRRHG